MVPNRCRVYKDSKKLSYVSLSHQEVGGTKSACLLVMAYVSIQYHSTIDIFTKYCTMQHKLKPCTWAILAIYQEVKMYWLFCCCDQMAKPSQVGYWLFCCCDQSLSSGVLVVTVFKIEFPEIKEIIIHGYPEKKNS